MAFRKRKPATRKGHGKYNLTYRNGTFRLNKFTVEQAGYPSHVQLAVDPETKEVLVTPASPANPDAYKLTKAGQTSWGNSFSSHELARILGLPETGQTVRFFTQWDPQQKAIRFSGKTEPEERETA